MKSSAKSSFLFSSLSYYLSAGLLSLAIVFITSYEKGFTLYLLHRYAGDTFFCSLMIKTVLDTGWYLFNPYLGAPLSYSLADYPMSDSASFLIIKFIGLFTQQYEVILNLFYFLTVPLITISAIFAFRRLGINRWLA